MGFLLDKKNLFFVLQIMPVSDDPKWKKKVRVVYDNAFHLKVE